MSRNVQPPWQETPDPPAGGSGVTPPDEQGTAQLVEVGPAYGDTAAHVAAQLVGTYPGAVHASHLEDHLGAWEQAAEQVYAWLSTKQQEQQTEQEG